MANDSMIDILTQLPLFQGVSRERMSTTVGSHRFHFLKYETGDVIAKAGEACTHVKFVIAGTVKITISNSDDRFRISQCLTAPDVISPDFLFGSSTIYPGTVVAVDSVSIVQITKADYLKVLASDDIFMFNFLNYLSRNAQKCVEGILALTTGSIEERLAMWIVCLTQPTAKDVQIVCKQRDLYSMFGVQRASFYTALEHMASTGAIAYTAHTIDVLDRRAMLTIMKNGVE